MRRLWIFMLPLIPFSASADMSTCDTYSVLSRSIMSARQSGTPMKQQMDIVLKSGGSPELQGFMKNLVIAAYEEPAWSSESRKEKAITDFENGFYLSCVKSQK